MKTMVTSPISLGNGEQAQARLEALRQWALERGLIWNGQPSISKLIQSLADERIKNAQVSQQPGTDSE